MTSTKIIECLSTEPFRPFRSKMISGQGFDIRHPEMILAGLSAERVYKASEVDPDAPLPWCEASLTGMKTIESLELTSATGMK